ncbi:3-phosphoshikimate 1-carboxyvinyltransferase [Chlamydiales bacterium STE3]|nr:3-phosphoshikimate 1-carboxyvinyltransferase [Chlamydiales bacterium STE3]
MQDVTSPSFFLTKSSLSGAVFVPPSKSHSLRAILLGSLAHGTSTIANYLESPDSAAMIEACRLLGAKITKEGSNLTIEGLQGCIGKAENVIDAGNSGLVLRFITAIASLSSSPIVITGDYSVRHQRPMHALLQGLEQAGVKAISTKGDGFAPIIVQGPYRGGTLIIDGEDSQPVSALLLAASLAEHPTELIVNNPGERPWVSLTLQWLKDLKVDYKNDGFKKYTLLGKSCFPAFDYRVPGDFSTAAFPIAAALITQSEVLVHNLDFQDSQGDKKFIEILHKMGAKISWDEKGCLVQKSPCLQGIEIDINDCIDALPILAVIGCYARGTTTIKNAKIARHKECDRISSITRELRKMGAEIEEFEDGLMVHQSTLKGALVDGCHDHRLSMALSVAALGSEGETQVVSIASISKTYPSFLHDFRNLNAKIALV